MKEVIHMATYHSSEFLIFLNIENCWVKFALGEAKFQ